MTDDAILTSPAPCRGRVEVRGVDDVWPGDYVIVDGTWRRVVDVWEAPPYWMAIAHEAGVMFVGRNAPRIVLIPERT
jgi:hypothetical protein